MFFIRGIHFTYVCGVYVHSQQRLLKVKGQNTSCFPVVCCWAAARHAPGRPRPTQWASREVNIHTLYIHMYSVCTVHACVQYIHMYSVCTVHACVQCTRVYTRVYWESIKLANFCTELTIAMQQHVGGDTCAPNTAPTYCQRLQLWLLCTKHSSYVLSTITVVTLVHQTQLLRIVNDYSCDSCAPNTAPTYCQRLQLWLLCTKHSSYVLSTITVVTLVHQTQLLRIVNDYSCDSCAPNTAPTYCQWLQLWLFNPAFDNPQSLLSSQ